MNQLGKIQQVENEFKKYGLDILALSETRCKEIGKETLEGGMSTFTQEEQMELAEKE